MADETKTPDYDPASPKMPLIQIIALAAITGAGAIAGWASGLSDVKFIALIALICVAILAWAIVQATTSHGAAKVEAARSAAPQTLVETGDTRISQAAHPPGTTQHTRLEDPP